MTFPSSPLGKEKRSCCFPNPTNVKRGPNIVLKDVECLIDTLFLIWFYLYSALADLCPVPICARGKEVERDDRAQRMQVCRSLYSYNSVGQSHASRPCVHR